MGGSCRYVIPGETKSLHQKHGTAALDLAGDAAMQVRGHSSHTTWQNFAIFGDELLQKVRVFVINGLDRDIDPAAGHDAVRTAEIGAALGCFG